jgi:hypothetical protein
MNKAFYIVLFTLLGFACGDPKMKEVAKESTPCLSQRWISLDHGIEGDPFVQSMLEYKGELFVTGRFTFSSNTHLRNIARWNGAKWDSVGSGFNAISDQLCIYKEELFVSGQFDEANGKEAHKIAKWNGNKWDAVGTGLNNGAYALAVFNDKLYAGGLDLLEKKKSNCLVTWNGSKWSAMKEEMLGHHKLCDVPSLCGNNTGKDILFPAYVKSLVVYKGCLYAGGNFKKVGKVVVNNIAKWNDTIWSPVGTGLSDSNAVIHAMVVYEDRLFIAGEFNAIDGKVMNNISMWDGMTWQPLGTGISGEQYNTDIKSMLVFKGELYVAGIFNKAGNKEVKCNLAKWDGKDWQAVGDKMSSIWDGKGHIESLACYSDELFAGGLFEKAGESVVNNIAKLACSDSVKLP